MGPRARPGLAGVPAARRVHARAGRELPEGPDPAAVVTQADRLLAAVGSSGRIPILLHGEGGYAWPALRHAVELGLQARIGLEDVLTLPDGTPAPDNAALVTAARTVGGVP